MASYLVVVGLLSLSCSANPFPQLNTNGKDALNALGDQHQADGQLNSTHALADPSRLIFHIEDGPSPRNGDRVISLHYVQCFCDKTLREIFRPVVAEFGPEQKIPKDGDRIGVYSRRPYIFSPSIDLWVNIRESMGARPMTLGFIETIFSQMPYFLATDHNFADMQYSMMSVNVYQRISERDHYEATITLEAKAKSDDWTPNLALVLISGSESALQRPENLTIVDI